MLRSLTTIGVVTILSWQAAFANSSLPQTQLNKSIELPDFTRGKWKGRKFTGFGIGTA